MMRLAVVILCVAASASAAPYSASGIADWTTPPSPSAEPTFVPPTAKRSALSNGITVVVVENHQLPIVALSIVVPGAGTASDPVVKPGTAAFTADMLDEGAGGLSAIQIAEEQDRLGAAISMATQPDAARIAVTTLTKTLGATIDLVATIVMRPALDPAEFQRVKGDRATALELLRDRPRDVVRNVLWAALYGSTSPYGHPGAGVRESFATIELGDVQAFYRQHWNPAAMTIVVAGDVDPVAVQRTLETALGAWRVPSGEVPKSAPSAELRAPRLRLVDRPKAAQSDVRIGTIGIDRRDPRFFAFEVATTALGGGFSSRLTQRLREQLGITYTAHAHQIYLRGRGPFEIATSIVTPATGRGIAEALRLVRELASKPIAADELDKVKLNLIRALPSSFEDNHTTAQTFADLALFELPLDFYASYAERIRAVTANEVLAAAKTALPYGAMVVSVVGDLATIRPQLARLRLGTPGLHDLYGASISRAARKSATAPPAR